MRDERRTELFVNDGLVVLSNRGPYALNDTAQGPMPQRTVGGLVAAVEPILERWGGVWITWLGRTAADAGAALPEPALPSGHKYTMQEVVLNEKDLRYYYRGFANNCLWPLAHGFLEKCRFDPRDWQTYQDVNRRFARQVTDVTGAGRLVWVHDYHLTLVPELVREQLPGTRIAFFWHVPFPPLEVFETLPWAREVLMGMLGSDQVDFHLPGYAANFIRCVRSLLGATVHQSTGEVLWEGRVVRVQAVPLGIDYDAFRDLAADPGVLRRAAEIRAAYGNRVLLLGIDRLDYTKGIPERLEAFEGLLESWPEARGKLVLLQVAVPGRGGVPAYRDLRRRVEELVGRINGRFADDGYQPVHYRARPLSRREVVAHYLAADVAVVTPLRDGLNLVAKEYVACRRDGRGVLVLSKFAGAARSMGEAVVVNPYHREDLVAGLRKAVEMSPDEQAGRLQRLQARVSERDLSWWWRQVQVSLEELAPMPQAAGNV